MLLRSISGELATLVYVKRTCPPLCPTPSVDGCGSSAARVQVDQWDVSHICLGISWQVRQKCTWCEQVWRGRQVRSGSNVCSQEIDIINSSMTFYVSLQLLDMVFLESFGFKQSRGSCWSNFGRTRAACNIRPIADVKSYAVPLLSSGIPSFW